MNKHKKQLIYKKIKKKKKKKKKGRLELLHAGAIPDDD
jgi:hypothetical protein